MTKLRPAATWPLVHAERRALAADLATLRPEQWETPSLCPTWTVHDVLAHLVDSAQTTRLGFVRRMIAARGDFDRDNATGLAREKRADPLQTLAAFRTAAELTSTPPADLATRLVEAYAHGEDIRRPLGIRGDYPVEGVVPALEYQLRTGASMGGSKERTQGVRLVGTDAGQSWGTGPEIHGSVIDLLLAITGRPVPADRFSGEGVPMLIKDAADRS
ncbi:maleylpyruvate isomerase family mycothiol-dependent enzyme [Microlunatus sp. GCM10028923]|uniref:maleylpyruvate isomerase family mycothiol-dependent enzyme n=1 Tax=Microlunatus sp. GCM10028923 TaxID=3273400 RepID=UPI00360BDEEB